MIDQFPWLQTLATAAIARQSKSADDIIRSATFPAAHAPSPDDSSQSEGVSWPYARPVLGTVGSRRACALCCLLGSASGTSPRLSRSNRSAAKKRLNLHPGFALSSRRLQGAVGLFPLLAQSRNVSLISVSALLFCAFFNFIFFSCHIILALASHISATNDLDRDP